MEKLELGNTVVSFDQLTEIYSKLDKIVTDITEYIDIFGPNLNSFIDRGFNKDVDDYLYSSCEGSPSRSLFYSIKKYCELAKEYNEFGFDFVYIIDNNCILDGVEGLQRFVETAKTARNTVGKIIKEYIDKQSIHL